jgi:Transglutaminase-like superfamily
MHDFYSQPGPMTSAGVHDLSRAPKNPADLARMLHGLVIHEFMAPAYGITVSAERAGESHIRHVDEMLDRIFELDPSPLTVARPPEKRLVGVCHHFSLLFVAMMRAHGMPVRYRQGFGTYFNPPYAEEHVVAEYWNANESRWILVDPQLDAIWRQRLEFDFDPLDVPRDRFIVAGDAWQQCRAGRADPAHFGIFRGNLRGLWFIAGEMVRAQRGRVTPLGRVGRHAATGRAARPTTPVFRSACRAHVIRFARRGALAIRGRRRTPRPANGVQRRAEPSGDHYWILATPDPGVG